MATWLEETLFCSSLLHSHFGTQSHLLVSQNLMVMLIMNTMMMMMILKMLMMMIGDGIASTKMPQLRFPILMTNVLRIGHLRIAYLEGNPEVIM